MLHSKTVQSETLFLLEELMSEPVLNNFMLVGGTALSLIKGHRISDDIDLFTDKEFNKEEVKYLFKSKYNRGSLKISEFTFGLSIYYSNNNNNHDVKIDIMNFSTDPFLKSPNIIDNIRFASLEDIAAMKFNAIKSRITKKDFIDIYYLLKDFSFGQILNFNKERFKYEEVKDSLIGISMIDKADSDPMPKMFNSISWDEIKKSIKHEASIYFDQNVTKQKSKTKDFGLSM